MTPTSSRPARPPSPAYPARCCSVRSTRNPVPLARTARATFVHPCWEQQDSPAALLTGAWLDTVRSHGLGVITWHEERPDILRQLLTLGVDGICTDDPALLAGLASLAGPLTPP